MPPLLSSLHLLQFFYELSVIPELVCYTRTCLLHQLYLLPSNSWGLDTQCCDSDNKSSFFMRKAGENVWGDYCEVDAIYFGMEKCTVVTVVQVFKTVIFICSR